MHLYKHKNNNIANSFCKHYCYCYIIIIIVLSHQHTQAPFLQPFQGGNIVVLLCLAIIYKTYAGRLLPHL